MKKIKYLSIVALAILALAGCKKKDETAAPIVEPVKPIPVNVFLADTTPKNRVALLEDFTGVRCGYCPDGHIIAKSLLDANPGKFIVIATNAGPYAQATAGWANYTTTQGNAINIQASPAGYPAGTVNRMKCTDLGVTAMSAQSNMTMDRGKWATAANKVMSLPAPVNIGAKATYDAASKVLTVKVDLYYTSSETTMNRLNISLLQSKLLTTQDNYAIPSPYLDYNYQENHVLRDMLTKGYWGDAITEATTTGSKISRTYTYTVPADYHGTTFEGGGAVVIDDLSIVAYVTRGNLEVLNAVEVDVK